MKDLLISFPKTFTESERDLASSRIWFCVPMFIVWRMNQVNVQTIFLSTFFETVNIVPRILSLSLSLSRFLSLSIYIYPICPQHIVMQLMFSRCHVLFQKYSALMFFTKKQFVRVKTGHSLAAHRFYFSKHERHLLLLHYRLVRSIIEMKFRWLNRLAGGKI